MNTTVRNLSTLTGSLVLAGVMAVVPLTSAQAKDGDVIRTGSCSGSADWKLKASPENGRIEVEGEIDSNKNGQTWKWKMIHNGSRSGSGTKTTKGPSGSFEVRRVMVNAKGTDKIVFKARHLGSGQRCRGVVRF